jgi:hypothetical protein
MTIDEVQEMMVPVETLQERVANRRYPLAITYQTQHQGNRVIGHFYPEHWAQVQLARATAHRWREDA